MAEFTVEEMFEQDGPLHVYGGFPRLIKVEYNRITFSAFKDYILRLAKRKNITVKALGMQHTRMNDGYFIQERNTGATLLMVPVFTFVAPRSIFQFYADLVTFEFSSDGKPANVQVITNELAGNPEVVEFFKVIVQQMFKAG